MVIKKRPFVLIEVFIAIALLTLSAFPLIGSSIHSYRKQKELLLSLELEREAELYFYQILKEKVKELSYDAIPTQTAFRTLFPELELSLGAIKEVYHPHYHLYYKASSKSKTDKTVWCKICFPKDKNSCPEKSYKFAFLVRKASGLHESAGEQTIKEEEDEKT